jgi:hypothetical protein
MDRVPELVSDQTWRGRSIDERASATEAACRGAMQLLQDAADREERLSRIDRVPESTRRHLRRLATS